MASIVHDSSAVSLPLSPQRQPQMLDKAVVDPTKVVTGDGFRLKIDRHAHCGTAKIR